MSETDHKKFWYIKLPKDFFNRHDIKILESQPNGKDYCLFYLKLLLESITHNGELRFNEAIPYDENMLSVVTNTDIDKVRTAMKVLNSLKLIEMWDDKTIFMTEVNKMMGFDTGGAIRKREYRERQKGDNVPQLSQDCPTVVHKCPQEKDIEIDIEIDKDLDLKKENIKEKKEMVRYTDIKAFIDENHLDNLSAFRMHNEINEKGIDDWKTFLTERNKEKYA